MAGEEVLDVGGVDPSGSAELVAGQFAAPDPVADGAVGDREVGGEGALGEEGDGGGFPSPCPLCPKSAAFASGDFRQTSAADETEGQTPAAPPYWRPSHGEAVPQSAARRGGEDPCSAPSLADVADHEAAAQARIRRVRSVSGVEVGAGWGSWWLLSL